MVSNSLQKASMTHETTEAKFTPGPWSHIGDTAGYITITAPNGFGLAEVDIDDTFDQQEPGEGEANANLIAAAPDLYEALEAFVRYIEVTNPDTGYVHCLCCQCVTDPQDAGEGLSEHTAACPAWSARIVLAKARGEVQS